MSPPRAGALPEMRAFAGGRGLGVRVVGDMTATAQGGGVGGGLCELQ